MLRKHIKYFALLISMVIGSSHVAAQGENGINPLRFDFDDDYVCFGQTHMQMYQNGKLTKEGDVQWHGTWGITEVNNKSIIFRDGEFKNVIDANVTETKITSDYTIRDSAKSMYINLNIKLDKTNFQAEITNVAERGENKYIRHFLGTCKKVKF